MQRCVIYIPGLGDHFNNFRQKSLRFWRIWNVKTVFVPMNWDTEKEFAPKLARLERAIGNCQKNGDHITLIGESAGSTVALYLAAIYDLPVITLCGVNNPKTHISPRTYARAPAFKQAFALLNTAFKTLDLLKVQSLTALIDGVVSPKNSVIKGARNRRLLSIGHSVTITLCLTVLSGYIVRLTKR